MAEALTLALILEARDQASEWIDRVRENVAKLAENVEQSSKTVAAASDQMSASLERTSEASTQATDSIDRQTVASDRSAAAMRDQAIASEEATVKTDEQSAATTRLGDTSEESAGKIGILSKASDAVGLAMLGVMAVSAKMAIDFQASTATLAGQANISTAAANQIGNAFVAAGGQTTFTANEMMAAFAPVSGEFVTMYGHALNAAQSMQVMNASMMLAEAGGGDLTTVTKALADAMMVFHLKTSQADSAANMMFNTSRMLGVSADSLASSLTRLEPKIAGSGMSLQQTSAFMVELAKSAGGGRTAMRLAGTAIQSLVSPSTTAVTALAQLGINVDNSHGKFIGLSAVIGKLHDALAKLPATAKDVVDAQKAYRLQTEMITLAQEPQTKSLRSQETALRTQISALNMSTKALSSSSVMTTLFGKSAGLMASLIAGGVPALNKASDAVAKAGQAAKAAAEKQATFEGQLKKLKSAGESLFIIIGQKLLPALTKLATATVNIAGGMVNWIEHNQTLATVIGGAVLALYTFVKAVEIVKAVTEAWAAAQAMLDVALDANAIGAAVVAIAALVLAIGYLITHFKQVVQSAQAAWHDIVAVWGVAANWWQEHVAQPVRNFFGAMWNQVFASAKAAWQDISGAWSVSASWFNSHVVQPIVGFFKSLWNGISSAASDAWHAITSVWDAVAGWFNSHIIQPIVGFFKTLWDDTSSGAKSAWHAITGVWDAVAGWFNSHVIQPIEGFFSGLWHDILSGVDATVSAVKSAFSSIMSAMNPLSDLKKLGGALHIPGLATGGMVTSPTLAVVGEAGPEMVIPLNNLPGGTGVVSGGGVSPLRAATSLPSSGGSSSGNVINITLQMSGQVYGDINHALNAMGRQLATILVPGSGTRLTTR